MNKVFEMGRLTRDPEIRSTNTGAQVALFSIAVDRKPSLKKGDESKENTDFFSITAWDKLAGFAENYLKQGTKVLILGHLQNDSYNDKNGNKVVRTKIVAESIEFCESKNSGAAPVAKAGEDFLNVPDDESLPFSF